MLTTRASRLLLAAAIAVTAGTAIAVTGVAGATASTERLHQIDLLRRIRAWFTRWLGDPAPAPVPPVPPAPLLAHVFAQGGTMTQWV